MKKSISIMLALVLCLTLFAGCAEDEKKETKTTEETVAGATVSPLPETIDIDKLDNCTVAVSLEKGNAYVDDSGKMVMKVKVYTYDLYDMVDIAALKEGDVIVRQGENVTVSEIERLETGLIHINGGEENGGFDLISNDNTVYYETGMNDIKAYYELGEVTLPVSTEFIYTDSSDLDAGEVEYYPGDFLTDVAGIVYNFNPNSTSIIIENGEIIAMNKSFMP